MFKVPLASSGLREKDIEAVVKVLDSGQLTMGKTVRSFEEEMARYLGVRHFIMVNSGSSANLLMLESLLRPTYGQHLLAPGDGVIVPAIAWPTTVWPIIQLGLNPIFVDVDPSTIGLDIDATDQLLSQTRIPAKAIFPIHPVGLALDSEKLSLMAHKHELVELHDVCEALGAFHQLQHAGGSAQAFSVSFYFSHHLTTMEGGGVGTNNDQLADDLRSMRSHGWSRDRSDATSWENQVSDNDSKFLFVSTGYNVRPMEIQAAIGLSQLPDLDSFITRRREIAATVNDSIEGSSLKLIGFEHFRTDPTRHSWMLLPIQIIGPDAIAKKQQVLSRLKLEGIETRPVLTGNFLSQPAIQRITKQRVSPDSFPNASMIAQTSFLVSCHHDLSDSQIEHLSHVLREVSRVGN